MIEQAFEVATEFKFEVGSALLNTRALTDAVQGVSNAATGALNSLQYLAGGLVARLGFGSGGLLTVLSRAVQLSEEFSTGTFGFVNSISSNMRFLSGTIGTFNDKLGTSSMLMEKVSVAADNLGISAPQLAQITQQVSGPLAARGKLGTNFSGGIEMAKNIMIGSEAMGISPMMLQEAMIRGMQPGQSIGGRPFERFIGTQAFQSSHIMHPAQLANMDADKKFTLLSDALKEVGGNADYLAARARKLSVQFNMMKAQLEAILKPIGDALGKALGKIFGIITNYLKTYGKLIGDSLGKLIGNIFDDPEGLLINLMQLKNLWSDFKTALSATSIYGSIKFLIWGLQQLGVPISGQLFKKGIVSVIEYTWGLLSTVPWIELIFGAFDLLAIALAEFLIPLTAFLIIFQTLSRAKAIAKVTDLKEGAKLIPDTAKETVKLKNNLAAIFDPIMAFIDIMANAIAPLFEMNLWAKAGVYALSLLNDMLSITAGLVQTVQAFWSGILNMWVGFIYDIIHLQNPFSNMLDNFKQGFDDIVKKVHARMGEVASNTSDNVVNIANQNIEIRNDFKEQLEPDRIAFSLKEQLMKVASNQNQGRGRSFQGAFAGATVVAGNR